MAIILCPWYSWVALWAGWWVINFAKTGVKHTEYFFSQLWDRIFPQNSFLLQALGVILRLRALCMNDTEACTTLTPQIHKDRLYINVEYKRWLKFGTIQTTRIPELSTRSAVLLRSTWHKIWQFWHETNSLQHLCCNKQWPTATYQVPAPGTSQMHSRSAVQQRHNWQVTKHPPAPRVPT